MSSRNIHIDTHRYPHIETHMYAHKHTGMYMHRGGLIVYHMAEFP